MSGEAQAQGPATPRQLDRTTLGLLDLRSPTRPSRRAPWPVAREVPDPLHEDGYRRFTGADLPALGPEGIVTELFRLRCLVALMRPEDVPAWIWWRLQRLREWAAAA